MSSRLCRLISPIALMILIALVRPASAQSALYVCNFFGSSVTIHDGSTGALQLTIPVFEPTGAEIGPDGYLYTVGYDRAIRRFNPTTGALLATIATNVATFPDDLHFGPDGNMYVGSRNTNAIVRFDGANGATIDTFISTNLNDPYRIRFFGTSELKLNRLLPSAVKTNSAAFQLSIDGTGFKANPIVRF